MKKYTGLLLISGCMIFIAARTGNAQSDISADKKVYDFGVIREGKNTPVTFTLKNNSTKPMRIRETRTFAACVESAPLTDNLILPGDTLTLHYIFESLGYGGITVNKKIEVYFYKKKNPLILQVTGRILPLQKYQAPVGEVSYNFFVLIDIREHDEFVKEHIIGAVHIPLDKVNEWVQHSVARLPEELILYVISERGITSDETVKQLHQKGYEQFFSIVGGMEEWKKQQGRELLISGTY